MICVFDDHYLILIVEHTLSYIIIICASLYFVYNTGNLISINY